MADGFDRGAFAQIARRFQSGIKHGKVISECLGDQRKNLLAVALHPFGDTLGTKSIAPDRGLIENRIRHIDRYAWVKQIIEAVGCCQSNQRPGVGNNQLGAKLFIRHGALVRPSVE